MTWETETILLYEDGSNHYETNLFRKQYFEQVYSECTWHDGATANEAARSNNISCSGVSTSSDTKHTQKTLREILLDPQLRIQHFLDAPCGDLKYMSHFMHTLWDTTQTPHHVEYHGADIVESLIQRHQQTYGQEPWLGSFQSVDFAVEDVVLRRKNGQPFDLIFSRQMTQHLSKNETCAVLRTFNRSGARYLLATTSLNVGGDEGLVWDTMTSDQLGNFVEQSLLLPPYSLPPPVYIARDDPIGSFISEKEVRVYLGLWSLPLPTSVCV